jgi:hypothetical protein
MLGLKSKFELYLIYSCKCVVLIQNIQHFKQVRINMCLIRHTVPLIQLVYIVVFLSPETKLILSKSIVPYKSLLVLNCYMYYVVIVTTLV